ncbi:unnamed protein product [Calypogeia fissa]
MSAAAHLLRRRSSSLLQQRLKIHPLSFPFLGTPIQSRNLLRSPAVQGRKFSATSTAKPPEISAAENNSSSGNSRALKVTAAGAAILLLSSGAWYFTRDEYPQVQYIGLPQIFHGRYQEEKAPSQVVEKPIMFVQTNEVQEEGATQDAIENTAEAYSHEREHTDEGQPLHEVADDRTVFKQDVETVEGQLEKSSPEPPVDSNEIPAVLEYDSRQQETQGEEIPPPKESGLENSVSSNETQPEDTQPAEEVVLDDQSLVEILVEEVKDTVSAVKEYLFDQSNDVSKDSSEAKDSGHDVTEEIILIREKLREENPEMFYSDTEDADDTQKDGVELGEELALLQMLESGTREYVDTYNVPSRLSASYLVQKGHEDSVRRYSEKEKEGEVQGFVEIAAPSREKEKSREESVQEETSVPEEQSKVVGVDVLVGAIHTAEQLQAEVDGRTYQEQLRTIQEAHKRELQDYQAKIFAYAEGTDQLEKELKREKEEAAAALKVQEQRAEDRLQYQLKQQEEEATKEKERVQLLEKALAEASLTREKAGHLDDLHSVQLQVDALRTAFYARSEEARISHTAHKLAMGAFALEDAIERGEAALKEAVLLVASTGGPGGDPLVGAVISSLPSEALTAGTGTRAQLHQKFTKLKGSLRELALMPSGGGGVFAHLFARITANLKIRETGSDDVAKGGIETVIGRVERLLAEENLLEAATVLETGVKGTAAEDLGVEWAKQARNRAVIEQGLQALKAHVIAVASEHRQWRLTGEIKARLVDPRCLNFWKAAWP